MLWKRGAEDVSRHPADRCLQPTARDRLTTLRNVAQNADSWPSRGVRHVSNVTRVPKRINFWSSSGDDRSSVKKRDCIEDCAVFPWRWMSSCGDSFWRNEKKEFISLNSVSFIYVRGIIVRK